MENKRNNLCQNDDSLFLISIDVHNPTSSPLLPRLTTAISDTGASGLYLIADAPTTNLNPSTPSIIMGTATCHIQTSTASCMSLPANLTDHLSQGHIFPAFKNSLVDISKFYDTNRKVLFPKDSVTVPSSDTVLTGWREPDGAKLWSFSLCPGDNLPPSPPATTSTTLDVYANIACNLPSVGALVRYSHAMADFPVKSIWLSATKCGNYDSWSSITSKNAVTYFP